jgi:hypothetical protein
MPTAQHNIHALPAVGAKKHIHQAVNHGLYIGTYMKNVMIRDGFLSEIVKYHWCSGY